MHTEKLTIGAQEFWLTDGHDISRLKCDVVQAAREGGALVGITRVGEPETLVLVTAHTSVKFETIHIVSDAAEYGDADQWTGDQQWRDVDDLVA